MKKPENIVLIDMDGVISDFDERVVRILQSDYPEVPLPPQRNNFYIDDDMPPEHKPIIREIISRPGFFTELRVLPDAHNGWERLLAAGWQPQICTSPLRKNPTCNEDKLSWLEEHFVPWFGHWVVDTAIIDKDKTRYPGIVLIDDRPKIDGDEKAVWRHVVFDQPYNKEAPSPLRLFGWKDSLLLPILASLNTTD